MRNFSSTRGVSDENSTSSRIKSALVSKLQQPTANLANRNVISRNRIGLNERANSQTLDPNSHQLAQHRPRRFQVFADENENLNKSHRNVDQYQPGGERRPLAERHRVDNIMSDNDLEPLNHSGEELIDDDVTTLDDVQLELEDDEDDEVEDDNDDEEDQDQPMSPKWNSRIYQQLQRVITRFSRDLPDEEDEDTHDISMVAEYAPEIFNYMHELESRLTPNPKYMDQQDELEWSMRSTLVGWLVQVHQRFNLLPETLFLTINYMDRFLSKRKVSLSRFQLVGAVALFLAAKYEEINCPSIQEIAYMVDHAYSVDDLLKAEKFMIGILEFEMGWPGPMSFLRRTSKADDYDFETRTLAKYFLEITIMDARFVASPPSWLAAGAHFLSRRLLNKGEWTEAHVFYSGYTEDQLRPLADALINLCQDPVKNHNAIYEKYQERRYRRSATFVQEWISMVQS